MPLFANRAPISYPDSDHNQNADSPCASSRVIIQLYPLLANPVPPGASQPYWRDGVYSAILSIGTPLNPDRPLSIKASLAGYEAEDRGLRHAPSYFTPGSQPKSYPKGNKLRPVMLKPPLMFSLVPQETYSGEDLLPTCHFRYCISF